MPIMIWKDTSVWDWKNTDDFKWSDDAAEGLILVSFAPLFPSVEFEGKPAAD